MKRPPIITVQLIHIHGPKKGEIQEFSETSIAIGRHPSCQIRFPIDMTSISRKHAEIVRDGNQFKLIDHSTNGTFVNGKRIKERSLRTGDVIEFAEKGPKVSFLTQMREVPAAAEELPLPPREKERRDTGYNPAQEFKRTSKPFGEKPNSVKPARENPVEISIQQVSIPLIIQFGPTIRSFKELPVTIGTKLCCGCILNHPGIFDQHAQIFFGNNQYWIKDLTGQGSVRINGQPIGSQAAPLKINNEIALSPQGPLFCFLGDGRLAEVVEAASRENASHQEELQQNFQRGRPAEKAPAGVLSKIKKKWSQ
jgi:pSer/pThr/pTyr-binding forkhead associated (FHA) protein